MTNNKRTTRKAQPRQTWLVTSEWKAEVRERLRAKGWNQTDLANATHISHVSISNLLAEHDTPASKHVPAINRVLSMEPPISLVAMRPTQARLIGLLDRLDADAEAKLLAMAELLPKKP